MNGRMIDQYGRTVEVITLVRARGPEHWIRVSWRRVLLGPGTTPGPGQGYYRTVSAALAHVDVESLVELVTLPVRPQETAVPDLDSAQMWADAITLDMRRTGRTVDEVLAFGRAHGHLCGVQLDLAHPDADSTYGVVASHGGWVVGYDGSVDAWTAR